MAPYQSINEALRKMQRREALKSLGLTPTPTPPPPISDRGSHLLNLPAELREQIWIHTVTSWTRSNEEDCMLVKQPIRVDNLNRPLPSAITRVNRQCYKEALHLYYIHNIFECWRPFTDWRSWSSCSTLMIWLRQLGPIRTSWLHSIVLLYKNEEELVDNLLDLLAEQGVDIREGVIGYREELSEFEMCAEQMGLPRSFGGRRGGQRWLLTAG